MSSFEARIAKHIIRLQKTKARQVTEQQRHAYYTAPGPLLHLLHNQAQRPANKERKETLTEKKTYEIPRKEACTSTEGVLPQRPEENTSKMPKEHACGGSLEADVQMRSEEEIEINKSLSEEGFRREIFEEQEEETLRQERLRRLVEEEDQRRYAAAELRRQEEERWYEELRQQEEEEEAQRRHEEQEVEEFQRQQEALRMRQEEEARRQQEELRKKKQDAQRQQHRDSREPKTRRFHPYMNTRDSGLERNEERAHPLGVVNQYGLRWDKLQNSPKGTRSLSFSDIPWPTKSTPSNPPDITKEAVKSFLASFGLTSNSKECVQRIRKEFLRWHPDKFSTSVLPMVYEDQAEQVEQAVNNVSGILADLMREARSSSDV